MIYVVNNFLLQSNAKIIGMLDLLAAYGRACCCAGIHCSSSPTVSPIKLFKVQITNKSSKEILLPEPLLIANKMMRIYSSASIAVKPLCWQ